MKNDKTDVPLIAERLDALGLNDEVECEVIDDDRISVQEIGDDSTLDPKKDLLAFLLINVKQYDANSERVIPFES